MCGRTSVGALFHPLRWYSALCAASHSACARPATKLSPPPPALPLMRPRRTSTSGCAPSCAAAHASASLAAATSGGDEAPDKAVHSDVRSSGRAIILGVDGKKGEWNRFD